MTPCFHEYTKNVIICFMPPSMYTCDMNSDFQEAFLEKCPHLKIVFDHFHIIKNFNEKVVAPVRIAEQKRLMEAGDTEAAESLKHTKYILTSKRTTLQRKDQEAREGKIISKGSTLFKEEHRVRKEGYEAKYDALLEENKLLFTIDLIKEKLDNAYKLTDPVKMGTAIADIVWDCMHTGNEHFEWFGRLLMNHHDGIITYAVYHCIFRLNSALFPENQSTLFRYFKAGISA